MRYANLGALALLLVLTFSNWRAIGQIQDDLDTKFDKMGDRIAAVSDKVGKAVPPPRRGPDPNKVYKVKTAGAPAKGPADAPVTIAEFSDFQ